MRENQLTKNKINIEDEKANAKYAIITNIVYFLSILLSGFLYVKVLILRYGDEISGFINFYTNIYEYITIVGSAIFISVLNRMITLYKKGEADKMAILLKWITRVSKYFALVFLILSAISSVIFSYIFFNTFLINIFFLSFSGGISVFVYYFFNMKYEIYSSAKNIKYKYQLISVTISIISLIVSCIILFYPKDVTLVKEISNGNEVVKISSSQNYLYYIIAISQFSLVIGRLISNIILRKVYKDLIIVQSKIKFDSNNYRNYISSIKKDLNKNLIRSLILSLSLTAIFQGDSLIISILKLKYDQAFILQKITISSLYTSVIIGLSTFINGYGLSQQVVIGVGETNDYEHMKLMEELKRKNMFLTLFSFPIILVISLMLVPLYYSTPGNQDIYLDVNFAIPMTLTSMVATYLTIQNYEIEIHSGIKTTTWTNAICAIFNLALAFSLILNMGVYWIFWVNLFSLVLKSIIYEIFYFLNREKGYRSNFVFLFNYKNKKNIFKFIIIISYVISTYLLIYFSSDKILEEIMNLTLFIHGGTFSTIITFTSILLVGIIFITIASKKKWIINSKRSA
ncbi:MAG: hypothetical protein NC236_00360 [Mycoplasma sp.]|nr:hypothetical protein [Mycoplasma sp.]